MGKPNKSDRVFTNKGTKEKKETETVVKVVNPFERKVNKVKHVVLGKKTKGESGVLGQSRYNAFEKRKSTLLVDMKESKKANKFQDQRIGENDQSMTEEEKMLRRYQKEKMKTNSLYNLNDEDEEELTHMGFSLGHPINNDDYQRDQDDEYNEEELANLASRKKRKADFDDEDLEEDEEEVDREEIKKSIKSTHEDGRPKTQKEIYQEIIEKSKSAKADRAREKYEDQAMQRKLDSEFDEIKSELFKAKKEDPLLALFKEEKPKTSMDLEVDRKKEFGISTEEVDEYNSLMFELADDQRANPTDRLKTEEEVIKEEAERLEKLEKERISRMKGEVVMDVEVDDKKAKRREQRMKKLNKDKENQPKIQSHLTADDLGDDDYLLQSNINAPYYNPNAELENKEDEEDEEEEDDDEEEDGDEEDEDDEEDDDDEDDDLEEDEVEEEEEEIDSEGDALDSEQKRIERELKKIEMQKQATQEIPYSFNVPKTLEELNQWLQGRSNQDKDTIYSRIKTCNHVSLKPQNKEKMKQYLPILYQRFLGVIQQSTVDMEELNWHEINTITKYIFDISQEVPETSGIVATNLINNCHKRITTRLENQKLMTSPTASLYPSIVELLSFKLMGSVFPTSDLQHQVITPTMTAMAQFITQCPIKNGHDILSSLFLTNIFIFYLSSTNRYTPEISSLLLSLLSIYCDHNKSYVINNEANKNTKNNKTKNVNSTTKTTTTAATNNTKNNNGQWATFQSKQLISTLVLPNEFLTIKSKKNQLISMEPSKTFDINLLVQFKKESTFKYYEEDQFKIDLLYLLIGIIDNYMTMCSKSEYKESLPAILQLFIELLNQLKQQLQSSLHKTLVDRIEKVYQNLTQLFNTIEATRAPLTLLTFKPSIGKQFAPRFMEVYSEHGHESNPLNSERKRLKKVLKREQKGAVRELIKDNQFIQQQKAVEGQEKRKQQDENYKRVVGELEKEQHEYKKYKKLKDRLDGRI